MEDNFKKAGFNRGTSYETFMLAVSLLSLVNLVILLLPYNNEIMNVVFIMDRVIGLIFLSDFLTRLAQAKSKKHYFFNNYGWADLLAAVPLSLFNIFRIFRIVRFWRAMRLGGQSRVIKGLLQKLSSTALYVVFFLILLVLEFGSMGMLMAEQGASEANIRTASDALWWAFVSIATVGYGDYYPVTDIGRMVGVLTIAVGVGLFGVVTGYLANAFLGNKTPKED